MSCTRMYSQKKKKIRDCTHQAEISSNSVTYYKGVYFFSLKKKKPNKNMTIMYFFTTTPQTHIIAKILLLWF